MELCSHIYYVQHTHSMYNVLCTNGWEPLSGQINRYIFAGHWIWLLKTVENYTSNWNASFYDANKFVGFFLNFLFVIFCFSIFEFSCYLVKVNLETMELAGTFQKWIKICWILLRKLTKNDFLTNFHEYWTE